MGVIIDTNVISYVFNKNNSNHDDFLPILNWIIYDKGKMIIGGKTYWEEMKGMESYLKYLTEFSRVNKICKLDDSQIDIKEDELKKMEPSKDFNDAHIIAMFIISKCKIYCSNDSKNFKYIHDPRFYPKNFDKPKIFTNINHQPQCSLLNDKNLCDCCKPHFRLRKEQADKIFNSIS